MGEDGDSASRGGKARAERMSPEQRRDAAQRAAEARWSRSLPQAVCGSDERPMRIAGGSIEVQCYVLEDGRRVLSQRGMFAALDLAVSGGNRSGVHRIAGFAASKTLEPYVSEELRACTAVPVRFRTPGARGTPALGYEATVLVDLCDAVLAARKDGALQKQQMHIADRCEVLLRAFAKVGIIALVDEATGYQYIRARRELEELLDKYISKELLEWTKTFPDDYYIEMFRLRGWGVPISDKRPGIVGKDTTDIVYARLAPGVLEELQRLTPRSEKGHLKHKLFQRLSEEVGHPKLREHLIKVVAWMQAATTWDEFKMLIDRAAPRRFTQIPLFPAPLPPDSDED
jgi:hypothetical protein